MLDLYFLSGFWDKIFLGGEAFCFQGWGMNFCTWIPYQGGLLAAKHQSSCSSILLNSNYIMLTLLCFVLCSATYIFCCVFRMLRSINGWCWSDEFPNLSSRSSVVAEGILLCLLFHCLVLLWCLYACYLMCACVVYSCHKCVYIKIFGLKR